jgi:hypothetical protein
VRILVEMQHARLHVANLRSSIPKPKVIEVNMTPVNARFIAQP